MSSGSGTIVRKRNRIHIERLELRRLLSGATFEVVDASTIINNFLSEIVVSAGSETPAGAEPTAADATVQPDSGEILIVQLPDLGIVDIGGGSSSEPASEIVDTTPTTDGEIIIQDPAIATPLEQDVLDPTTPEAPEAVDETLITVDPMPEIDPVVPIDTGIDTGLETGTEADIDIGVDVGVDTGADLTDPLTPVIDIGTDPTIDPSIDPFTPVIDVELPTDTIDVTMLPELPVVPELPVFSDDPIVDLNPAETMPEDVFENDPAPTDMGTDMGENTMPDLPAVAMDDTPAMSDVGAPEVVEMTMTPSRPTTATPHAVPATPVASTPKETAAAVSATFSTPVASQMTTTSESATAANVRTPAASQQSSATESATASAAEVSAPQAAFEPAKVAAAPEAPAPQPQLVAIGADIDSTGQREASLGEELGPDGKIKLVRVVWTFLDEAPIEQNQNESEAPAEQVQAAAPVVAEGAVSAAAAQGPLVIQLVQEVDVTPGTPEAAAAQAAGATAQTGEIEFASAGIGGGLAESGNTGRNIALALVAGAATVGVQMYRASKRKLAAAARLAFDPLGAWLDDSDYRE